MCSPEKDCLLSFFIVLRRTIALGEDEWLDVSNRLTIRRQESHGAPASRHLHAASNLGHLLVNAQQ